MPRPDDLALPDVFTRPTALARGFTPSQVQTRLRTGRWRTLRRGALCAEETWRSAGPSARQLLGAKAALLVVAGPVWVSHASAAAVHGLPVPLRDDRAWLTRVPPGSTVNRPGLTIEVATLPPHDRRLLRGLPVTSLRRTVADCLRHCHPADALAIADAAERARPGITSSVLRVLEESDNWPYAGRAGVVLPLVDGLRESPLESWSAWEMHVAGLPRPEPQVDIFDEHGTFVGRADFWWHEQGLAGEADGRTKYDVAVLGDVAAVADSLRYQQEREKAIRRTGAEVTRWGAVELGRPRTWARELARDLDRRSTFRGTAVPTRGRTGPWPPDGHGQAP